MAYRDDWRSDRSRLGPFWDPDGNVDRWRSAQRDSDSASNYPSDREEYLGVGFQRRGWRPGSDYYGDDPNRYGDGGGSFNPGQYEGQRDDRGVWENNDIDYSGRNTGRTSPQSFNDRWQDTYRGQSEKRVQSPSESTDLYRGQFRGCGPKGYRRSDDRIREDVCERLTQDDRVDASNIEVTVKDGEVTLSGTTHSREDKRRAEDIVDSVSGVRDVSNSLRVSKQDTQSQDTGQQADTSTGNRTGQGSRH
jgi:osmotically-inducible protein OsmY